MQRPIGDQLRELRTRISNSRRVSLGLAPRDGGGLTQHEVAVLLGSPEQAVAPPAPAR